MTTHDIEAHPAEVYGASAPAEVYGASAFRELISYIT
ncbi:hypothetical protein TM48_03738 [Mycobacterium shottsii]|nr:hypothetical protein TM48_03738 [Mycobacterium shottsii]